MKSNIDIKSVIASVQKFIKLALKHAVFIAAIFVLFVYLFTVWKIGKFAAAEPTVEDQDKAQSTAKVIRVDPNAVKQIQALEQRNDQIQSLFSNARDPFHE